MKKVHTLTFQNALNYGTALQCVALYRAISNFTDCDVIDYYSPKIEDTYKVFSFNRSLKKNIRGVLLMFKMRTKRKKFHSFLNTYAKLTKPFTSLKELEREYSDKSDVFIVGSDQVWNFDLTDADDAYFLSFVPNTSKKMSYAASIGKDLPDAEVKHFQEKLSDFSTISVRETMLHDRLNEIGVSSYQHIDPVFLLDVEDWKEMSMVVEAEDQPYVLVYLLRKSKSFMNKITAYAKENKLRLVIITEIDLNKIPNATYIRNCGPQEFIRYIMKANVIFTNSFHGISFSILFNKIFYFEYLENQYKTNSRLKDIITLFGLEKQDSSSYEKIPFDNNIDYKSINEKISTQRSIAEDFLKKEIVDER